MKPSVLFLDDTPRKNIAAHVFDDINLSKLLPEKNIEQMSVPCTADEMLARQKIFAALNDEGFYEKLSALKGALVNLSQAETSRLTSKCKCEDLIRFRRYAELYEYAHKLALDLPPVSPLIESWAFFLRAKSDKIALLRERLDATEPAFKRVCSSMARFKPSIAHSIAHEDDGTDLCLQFRALTSRLGYNLPAERRAKDSRMEPELSEAMIALYPEQYAELEEFKRQFIPILTGDFSNHRFELDFYLNVTDLVRRAAKKGIPSCIPAISQSKRYSVKDAFDVSLLVKDSEIVPNDIDFSVGDGNYFLTGANGGGKTTYLRAAAVNLILAITGCPIFARAASVWAFTSVYTHFPADERFTGSGRLFEEENRASEILTQSDSGSFVFLNETYSGTDDKKGVEMTLKAMTELSEKGAFALYVTHFHDVADSAFPMLNTVVDPLDTSSRTYRIVKSSAIRSSFAFDILRKYALDEDSLSEKAGVRV